MAISTNIFPIYLDAATVAVVATTEEFKVTSSRVTLDGTAGCDVTIKDIPEVGTVVRFEAVNSVANPPSVEVDSDIGGANYDETVTLNAVGDAATFMYFESGWRLMGLEGSSESA